MCRFVHRHHRRRPKISLLIPIHGRDPHRLAAFKWLLRYYKFWLPDAEIIIGRSRGNPFCKTRALNNAAKKAHGKVLVLLDADAFLSTDVIEDCADRILQNLEHHLWFVPYRRLYRLTPHATRMILESNPYDPFNMPDPPPSGWIDGDTQAIGYGHRYGAMAMIFPRQALDVVKGWDERFKGWGGEDVAFLRAMDTLYGKHKTTNNAIYHLWHSFSSASSRIKLWNGQRVAHPNQELTIAYHRANKKPGAMQKLVYDARMHRTLHARIMRAIKRLSGR